MLSTRRSAKSISAPYAINRSIWIRRSSRPVKGLGFVNADYIISSLRQQLTAANCLIQEDKETADIIVEPRVGALGTNGHEVTYGMPQTSAISSAAAAFASSPIVPSVPEISFGRLDAHSGIAKIIVFAFEKSGSRVPSGSRESQGQKVTATTHRFWALDRSRKVRSTTTSGLRAGVYKRLRIKATRHSGNSI